MRSAGDQAKTACGNLHMCTGLKAGIEGVTHAVGHSRLEGVIFIRKEVEESGGWDEEDIGGVAARLNNIRIETTGTEEEAAEQLETALEMYVEEIGEGEEGGEET